MRGNHKKLSQVVLAAQKMIDSREADLYSDEPLVIILSEMLNVGAVDLVDDIRNLMYTMQDLQAVECSMV